ncbi:hypothetical protein [Microbacterium sp. A84]|uniref:hypothetical protein n=1 Tax=Microbacterium sp. A84 TaxID=3450715 RepID=UPI003F434E95
MMLRNGLRGVLAASLAVGLVGVGATANAASTPTSAVLAPTSGPVTGGTEVTIERPAGVTFTRVSAGDSHVVAVAEDAVAYAWGGNGGGQLGDGTGVDRDVPVLVLTHTSITGVSFGGISAIDLVNNDDGSWVKRI